MVQKIVPRNEFDGPLVTSIQLKVDRVVDAYQEDQIEPSTTKSQVATLESEIALHREDVQFEQVDVSTKWMLKLRLEIMKKILSRNRIVMRQSYPNPSHLKMTFPSHHMTVTNRMTVPTIMVSIELNSD